MKLLTLLIFTLPLLATAQQKEHQEINNQVWKPFIQAFNSYNTAAFMAVHHKDLARVPRDSKVIYTFTEYKQRTEDYNQKARKENLAQTIELRFIERITNPTQAFEVGIYKTTITQPDAEPKAYYGKFTVLLKKENNTWKITMDSDSAEKNTISATDFIAASPME